MAFVILAGMIIFNIRLLLFKRAGIYRYAAESEAERWRWQQQPPLEDVGGGEDARTE